MTCAAMGPVDAVTQVQGSPRLLVTRRDPETRTYSALGFLTFDGSRYRFAYLRNAVNSAGFRALPGLGRVDQVYESDQLFPVFAERVISARRPDRQVSMDALGLHLEAAPFEVLQRSGGRRVGDTIEVLPAPTADRDGLLSIDFLVHGVRYQPVAAQERISRLRFGEQLRVVRESNNKVDDRALLITDRDEVALGYVPRPLLDLVYEVDDQLVTVLRANGPEVGFHFRLLVRLIGRVAAGRQPFGGPEWETVA